MKVKVRGGQKGQVRETVRLRFIRRRDDLGCFLTRGCSDLKRGKYRNEGRRNRSNLIRPRSVLVEKERGK